VLVHASCQLHALEHIQVPACSSPLHPLPINFQRKVLHRQEAHLRCEQAGRAGSGLHVGPTVKENELNLLNTLLSFVQL
jgi:hypothetical protein